MLYSQVLQQELSCFPYLQAIMLMGDVAKSASMLQLKQQGEKAVLPRGSTYKLMKKHLYGSEYTCRSFLYYDRKERRN